MKKMSDLTLEEAFILAALISFLYMVVSIAASILIQTIDKSAYEHCVNVQKGTWTQISEKQFVCEKFKNGKLD